MLKQKFLEFGYTEEEYNLIRNSHGISTYTDTTLTKQFINITSYLLDLGYTKENIIKMAKSFPTIYGYSIENMNQKIDNMIGLGYTREEVIKMTKVLPQIYSLSIANIKQKIEDMIGLGYTKAEVLKMTKTSPAIYNYSIENINKKINDMIGLGYTREEVIKMTKSSPTIYNLSIENMNIKINDMIDMGYTRAEVLNMTKSLPTIYGLSIENIREKIEFYDSINMHELAVKDPKQLMQSVALSYARYMFYLSRGIEINMGNYNKLFINNKLFEKSYGKTKQEILEEYNYNLYINKNKTL